MSQRRRPSPTTVIACLALFFAIAGGSAIALQGRNSVNSGDIKPKAVKTSDIAPDAVNSAKIRSGQVFSGDIQDETINAADIGSGEVRSGELQDATITSTDIGDGQVREADLAAEEPYHLVGATGEPQFGNGGEGDCIWTNLGSIITGYGNRAAFYKDSRGVVHLAGVVISQDGPAGDGTCNTLSSGAEGTEDSTVFVLPPGYRPENLEFPPLALSTDPLDGIIGADTNVTIQGSPTIPAGAVLNNYGDEQTLSYDSVTFRAAG